MAATMLATMLEEERTRRAAIRDREQAIEDERVAMVHDLHEAVRPMLHEIAELEIQAAYGHTCRQADAQGHQTYTPDWGLIVVLGRGVGADTPALSLMVQPASGCQHLRVQLRHCLVGWTHRSSDNAPLAEYDPRTVDANHMVRTMLERLVKEMA